MIDFQLTSWPFFFLLLDPCMYFTDCLEFASRMTNNKQYEVSGRRNSGV